ncbi:hypothetical protein WN55_04278, partial [Dufourea novaeangliae]
IMKLSRQHLPNRINSKNGQLKCPPRQSDLTAPDFFLWGYLKEKINIREEIALTHATLEKVMENSMKRFYSCFQHHDAHLTDLIFHI